MLVGVVGKVGCGKSSLLYAILGEMVKEGGSIGLEDYTAGFALASQEAWLQHATLRENILFGKPYNIRRYDQVVEACALSEDLQVIECHFKFLYQMSIYINSREKPTAICSSLADLPT